MVHPAFLTTPFLLFGSFAWLACNTQVAKVPGEEPVEDLVVEAVDPAQLSDYIVAALEDKKGNLWFGTVGDGVIRYSPSPAVAPGDRLKYFTTEHGLADMVSSSIVEDQQGHLWIGSHDGATRFDGSTFTAFKTPEGLHGMGCVLCVDRNGTLWAGTNDGAFRFDGSRFQPFVLPLPSIKQPSRKWVAGKVWAIFQDSKGNLWFGRDAYGACRYDGRSFRHFTKEDGLCSNNVASIAEDAEGNLWFGSITSDFPPIQEGGVARFDGKTMVQFPEVNGLTGKDVYTVYALRSGQVWIGSVGVGAYRYTPPKLLQAGQAEFALFDETSAPDRTQNFGVQAVLEDSRGTLWFGFSGGLFRFEGNRFENVTRGGPWPAH